MPSQPRRECPGYIKANRAKLLPLAVEQDMVDKVRARLIDTLVPHGYSVTPSNAASLAMQREIKGKAVMTAAIRQVGVGKYRLETTRFCVRRAKLTSFCKDVHYSELMGVANTLLTIGHPSIYVKKVVTEDLRNEG